MCEIKALEKKWNTHRHTWNAEKKNKKEMEIGIIS